jgi:hypothetical protein
MTYLKKGRINFLNKILYLKTALRFRQVMFLLTLRTNESWKLNKVLGIPKGLFLYT